MIVSDIEELSVVTIIKNGIPNEECIAIKVNLDVNLGQYGIMLGRFNADNTATPFKDNMFWFGDGIVKKGDWLFIYTGSGKPTQVKDSNNTNQLYSLYWGKEKTMFANTNVVPILFRVDAVDVLMPPADVPQIGN